MSMTRCPVTSGRSTRRRAPAGRGDADRPGMGEPERDAPTRDVELADDVRDAELAGCQVAQPPVADVGRHEHPVTDWTLGHLAEHVSRTDLVSGCTAGLETPAASPSAAAGPSAAPRCGPA